MPDLEASLALQRAGDLFRVRVPDGWRVEAAANGGFLAATSLGAMRDTLARPEQAARSLGIHYLRPLLPGEATIEVELLRPGRRLSTLQATYRQDGRVIAIAFGAFGSPLPAALSQQRAALPPAPPPGSTPSRLEEFGAPYCSYWDYRLTLGARPYSGDPDTTIGGWIRAREPSPADARVVAAMTDAFPPAVLSRLERRVGLVPTIDLTIHFRRALPWPGTGPDDFCFARFQTQTVADGYLEEDGAIWAADGALLAQSRQLAILG